MNFNSASSDFPLSESARYRSARTFAPSTPFSSAQRERPVASDFVKKLDFEPKPTASTEFSSKQNRSNFLSQLSLLKSFRIFGPKPSIIFPNHWSANSLRKSSEIELNSLILSKSFPSMNEEKKFSQLKMENFFRFCFVLFVIGLAIWNLQEKS